MALLARSLRSVLAAGLISAGVVAVAGAGTCPTSTLAVAGVPVEEIAGPTAGGTRLDSGTSQAVFYFREYGDSVRFGLGGGGSWANLTVRGSYRFLGAAPGTWLSNQVQVSVTGALSGYGGDPYCEDTWAEMYVSQDQTGMGGGRWNSLPVLPPAEGCHRSFATSFSFTCTHPVGVEFELATHIQLYITAGFSESAGLVTKRDFGELPPGAFMIRCDGDTTVEVVSVGTSPSSALRIEGIRPNPSNGAFRAAVSIPVGGPAIAQLLDVNGRILDARTWDASHASRRELTFERALPPGFYFLKVSQGAVTAVREVVIRH